MSARVLPREFGVVITCNVDDCTERFQTALIHVKKNRAAAKSAGWIRGGGKGRARFDICPTHAPAERELVKTKAEQREARKVARDAKRKERDAMIAAGGKPKRVRKPRAKPTYDGASA